MRRRRLPVRLLIKIGSGFAYVEGGNPWTVLKDGLVLLRPFDRCAFLGGAPWVRATARVAGALFACDMRTYAESGRSNALSWLLRRPASSAEAPALRILPEQETLLIELGARLCQEDLDSIREISRRWMGPGAILQSLVFHGARFPGWEDPGSLDSHWRFLRDELPDLRRVAVATRGPLGAHFAFIGRDIVDAEIRLFSPNQLYDALSWAGELTTCPGRRESSASGESRLRRTYG
jgi:hypothetical protein